MRIDRDSREFIFNPRRDGASAAIGVLTGGTGLVGLALKKWLISEDSSFAKRFLIGLLSLAGGPASLVSYWVAKPGWSAAQRDVQQARTAAAEQRYGACEAQPTATREPARAASAGPSPDVRYGEKV